MANILFSACCGTKTAYLSLPLCPHLLQNRLRLWTPLAFPGETRFGFLKSPPLSEPLPHLLQGPDHPSVCAPPWVPPLVPPCMEKGWAGTGGGGECWAHLQALLWSSESPKKGETAPLALSSGSAVACFPHQSDAPFPFSSSSSSASQLSCGHLDADLWLWAAEQTRCEYQNDNLICVHVQTHLIIRSQFSLLLFWGEWTAWVQVVDVSCFCLEGSLMDAWGRRLGVLGSSHHCQRCCLCCWVGWSYCAVESPGYVNEGAENDNALLSQLEVRKQTELSKVWVTLLEQLSHLECLCPKTETEGGILCFKPRDWIFFKLLREMFSAALRVQHINKHKDECVKKNYSSINT